MTTKKQALAIAGAASITAPSDRGFQEREMHITDLLAVLAFAQSQMAAPDENASQAEATAQNTPEIVVTGEKPKRDRKVCKRENATGSIMPTTTCRPASEWEAITERSLVAKEQLDQEREARTMTTELRAVAPK